MPSEQACEVGRAERVISRHLRDTERVLQVCAKVMRGGFNAIDLAWVQTRTGFRGPGLNHGRLLRAAVQEEEDALRGEADAHLG